MAVHSRAGGPNETTACPSASCRPGAVLIGIVLPDGRVAFGATGVTVDKEFARVAHEGRPPEQRFRFSAPCMRDKCRQWDGHQCGLVDRLIAEYEREFGTPARLDPLPACPVRERCRWFRQRPDVSCTVCSVLMTDVGRPDEELPEEVRERRKHYAQAS